MKWRVSRLELIRVTKARRIQTIGEGNQKESHNGIVHRTNVIHGIFYFEKLTSVFLLANSIRNASTTSGKSVSTVVWAAADVDLNEMFVWERFRSVYLFSKLNVLFLLYFYRQKFQPLSSSPSLHRCPVCTRERNLC